jgi:Ca2+-binding EF-hand superfamily protein
MGPRINSHIIDKLLYALLFNPETDLSCHEVLHAISATTSQNDAAEEMKEAFRVDQKENFALPIIKKRDLEMYWMRNFEI